MIFAGTRAAVEHLEHRQFFLAQPKVRERHGIFYGPAACRPAATAARNQIGTHAHPAHGRPKRQVVGQRLPSRENDACRKSNVTKDRYKIAVLISPRQDVGASAAGGTMESFPCTPGRNCPPRFSTSAHTRTWPLTGSTSGLTKTILAEHIGRGLPSCRIRSASFTCGQPAIRSPGAIKKCFDAQPINAHDAEHCLPWLDPFAGPLLDFDDHAVERRLHPQPLERPGRVIQLVLLELLGECPRLSVLVALARPAMPRARLPGAAGRVPWPRRSSCTFPSTRWPASARPASPRSTFPRIARRHRSSASAASDVQLDLGPLLGQLRLRVVQSGERLAGRDELPYAHFDRGQHARLAPGTSTCSISVTRACRSSMIRRWHSQCARTASSPSVRSQACQISLSAAA